MVVVCEVSFIKRAAPLARRRRSTLPAHRHHGSSDIAQSIANIGSGNISTLLAEVNGEIPGYASVHRKHAQWSRSVGELRVNAARQFRGIGLGRSMVSEAFSLRQALGLKWVYRRFEPVNPLVPRWRRLVAPENSEGIENLPSPTPRRIHGGKDWFEE